MMIKVDRSPFPIPDRVNVKKVGTSAHEEFLKALAALEAGTPFSSGDFKAYSNKKVREALIELFNGKCAYCESPHAASGDVDIEHYRPKSKVAENDDHPGYWWLAGDWHNLVMSCTHCNQNRTLEVIAFVPDEEATEEAAGQVTVIKKTVGKLDAFPTLDETWVTEHGIPMSQEKPFLIDPTITDPQTCLDYVFHENEFCTIFGIDPEGRGARSIEILGLNRRLLTETRFLRQLTLQSHAQQISNALNVLNGLGDAPDPALKSFAMQTIDTALDALWDEGSDDRIFAGMCRSFYQQQLARVDDVLGR
ncbi:HNH endonuclease [Algirhabdus cladophorae]|uniref:HNH endonuclease n=1 Tax=Algirhabdus cladophorae TaxID=3377108 RepID=UPI003B848D5A